MLSFLISENSWGVEMEMSWLKKYESLYATLLESIRNEFGECFRLHKMSQDGTFLEVNPVNLPSLRSFCFPTTLLQRWALGFGSADHIPAILRQLSHAFTIQYTLMIFLILWVKRQIQTLDKTPSLLSLTLQEMREGRKGYYCKRNI